MFVFTLRAWTRAGPAGKRPPGGGGLPPQPAPRSRAGPAARVSRCGDCRGPAAGTVHARFKGSQARLASRCHPGLTPPATGPPVAYGPSDRLRPSAQIVSAAQPERPPAARRPCRLRASPETAASGPAPVSSPRRSPSDRLRPGARAVSGPVPRRPPAARRPGRLRGGDSRCPGHMGHSGWHPRHAGAGPRLASGRPRERSPVAGTRAVPAAVAGPPVP